MLQQQLVTDPRGEFVEYDETVLVVDAKQRGRELAVLTGYGDIEQNVRLV